MAQTRDLAQVLRSLVDGIAQCQNVVLARLWLVQPGDICQSCKFRDECPDQSKCLHLVASAGNANSTSQDYSRLDGAFRRFPLGVRKIGVTAQTGTPLLLSQVKGTEPWVAQPEWVKSTKTRSFAAQPLTFRGENLGVLALFDRDPLTTKDFEWLRVVADHAAVSIINARSFEEINMLRARLEEENRYLRDEVNNALGGGNLLGKSAAMAKVLEQIRLVAPTDATVLITGESGTGKEVVARSIHDQSDRKTKPFIKVNCSAVPDSLFESEFFGHAKGAFTGALRDKPGRFELADGGTLLLDEIGEVPLAMQAKLLRVLQEQEVERVGEHRVRKLNVRVLAATNRDLSQEVKAGRFRQDLFYRLSVFPISIPPLRERTSDIEELASFFATTAAHRMKIAVPKLPRSSVEQLKKHDWPGNVRELQHAIERAVILAKGGPLTFDFSPSPQRDSKPSQRAVPPSTPLTRADLRQQEKDAIIQALRQSGGKVFGPQGAAEILGMKPTTLASRIKALKIEKSE